MMMMTMMMMIIIIIIIIILIIIIIITLENIKQTFLVEWVGGERRTYKIFVLNKWGMTNRMEGKWKPL
jgi:preprotein translocase subunit SecG